jgi:arylsulfatase A-like enzyme
VPRVPHPRFVGKSGMGPRGDAILQADWQVGEILRELDELKLAENTLVLFSSDNGPVLDDGYRDAAVEKLGNHKPAGPFRGGKYSSFEAGTRVCTMLRWPARVKPGKTSAALVSQIDFAKTFTAIAGVDADFPDSLDQRASLLGESDSGRDHIVQQAGRLSIRVGAWKLIPGGKGAAKSANTGTELGNAPEDQLYNLSTDPGETMNLAKEHPDKVEVLKNKLAAIRG